ncbi:MAG: hypothetical protein K2L45_06910 [Muribaculaceae bacterium]|nr:hypothetical protein [Muribaculaceae bacterium]MDE6479986.1 hypothetical protein [Muribaculaceae bacterium]
MRGTFGEECPFSGYPYIKDGLYPSGMTLISGRGATQSSVLSRKVFGDT